MNHITVFFAIEIIGTAAFACSGGMVAIRKHLDLLGIIVLGVTTAVGGGMLCKANICICSLFFRSYIIRYHKIPPDHHGYAGVRVL